MFTFTHCTLTVQKVMNVSFNADCVGYKVTVSGRRVTSYQSIIMMKLLTVSVTILLSLGAAQAYPNHVMDMIKYLVLFKSFFVSFAFL